MFLNPSILQKKPKEVQSFEKFSSFDYIFCKGKSFCNPSIENPNEAPEKLFKSILVHHVLQQFPWFFRVQSSLDFGDFWDRSKLSSPKSKSPKSRLYVCSKWAQELTK